jgi:hypothetical protein
MICVAEPAAQRAQQAHMHDGAVISRWCQFGGGLPQPGDQALQGLECQQQSLVSLNGWASLQSMQSCRNSSIQGQMSCARMSCEQVRIKWRERTTAITSSMRRWQQNA